MLRRPRKAVIGLIPADPSGPRVKERLRLALLRRCVAASRCSRRFAPGDTALTYTPSTKPSRKQKATAMTTYTAPVRDMQFIINDVLQISKY